MLLTTHPELHFTVNLSSSVDQEDTSGEAEVYITATRGNHSERFEGAASESKSDFEMKYILGEGHKNLSDFGATMKENRLRSSAIDQAIESFDKEG